MFKIWNWENCKFCDGKACTVCIRDQKPFNDEERKTYWKALDKESISTGINVFNLGGYKDLILKAIKKQEK